jgi:hypothetical protein
LFTGQNLNAEMSVRPKLTSGFTAFPIKISATFFVEAENVNSKIYTEI